MSLDHEQLSAQLATFVCQEVEAHAFSGFIEFVIICVKIAGEAFDYSI